MYKKSQVLKKIRREMDAGNMLSVAIRRSGARKQTIANWRKRPMIDRYFELLKDACANYRLALVEDALFKACMRGSIAAIIFFLCNRDPLRWKKNPDVVINQSQHIHITEAPYPQGRIIFRDIKPENIDNQKYNEAEVK